MKLDLKRLTYLGYWKIYEQSKVEDFKKVTSKVSADFGSKFPPLSSAVGFEKVKDLPLEGGINKLWLRKIAERIIPEIGGAALCFEDSIGSSVGNWWRWSGDAAHALRGHDDFRESQSSAPKIALWVSELLNDDGTATLLVLHGTADGNMQGLELEGLPDNRAGSGTERIFEYLWSQDRGLELENFSRPSYSPARISELCVWMIGVSQEWRRGSIESLFRVHYDESVYEGERQISPLARRDGENRPAVVSRIVIGSPIVVQTPPARPAHTSGLMKRWVLHIMEMTRKGWCAIWNRG